MYRFGIGLKSWQNRCVACQLNAIDGGLFCAECHQALPIADDFLIQTNHQDLPTLVACTYTGLIRRAMSAIKDNNNPNALPIVIHSLTVLADKLEAAIQAGEMSSQTLILPVPTTPNRLGEKGWHLVGVLAEYLSQLTGFELYRGVVRVVDRGRQRGLGRDARLENIQDVFELAALPNVSSVLIFDDVITTGATVGEIANTLWRHQPSLTLMAGCVAHGN